MVSIKHLSRKILAPAFMMASMGLGAAGAFAQEIPETPENTANTITLTQEEQSYIDWYNPPKEVNSDLFAGFLIGGGLLYGAFLLYGRRKGMQGTFLRAAAAGALITALCNPQSVNEQLGSLPTDVLILTDATSSQSLGDREDQTQNARDLLIERLSAQDNVNIRTIEVEDAEDDIAKGGSKIFTALNDALSNIPKDQLGAVIILTDGQIHDVPEFLEELDVGAPVHGLVTGRDDDFDRSLIIDQSPVFGAVGAERTIKFHVEDQGQLPEGVADTVDVRIKINGEVVDTIQTKIGETVEYTAKITHAGENVIVFEADNADSELTDINNRVVTAIRGVEESLNLLVISGQPHRGFTALREFFWSDPDANPVHYTTLRTPLQQDYTEFRETALTPFPKYEIFVEKLKDFDLVIMDNVSDNGMIPAPYFKRLAEHVENGGAMLVITDPTYQDGNEQSLYDTPLEDVLNVKPDATNVEIQYKPEVTALGSRHPVTRDLAEDYNQNWGSWTFQNAGTTTGMETKVIMEGAQGNPLVVLSEEGEGRVATITSNSMWLWANNYQGGGPYAQLINATAKWLLRDPTMEEEQLNLNVRGDALKITVQTLNDEPSAITVLTPSGEKITPELVFEKEGLWHAQVKADEIGEYRVEQDGENGLISTVQIGPEYADEYTNTVSTTTVLSPVLQDQGYIGRLDRGADDVALPKIVPIKQADSDEAMAGDDWLGIKMNDKTVVMDNDRKSLIPGWLGALVIGGLFSAAWLRRKTGFNLGFSKKADDEDIDTTPKQARKSDVGIKP